MRAGTYAESSTITLARGASYRFRGEGAARTFLEFSTTERLTLPTDPGEYSTGTIAFATNSNTITGTGTAWLANVAPGDVIMSARLGLVFYVSAVASDTSLTISGETNGQSLSGVEYVAFTPSYVELSGLFFSGTVDDGLVTLRNTAGMVVRNCAFQNADNAGTRYGLHIERSANASVSESSFTGTAGGSGMYIAESVNNIVRACRFSTFSDRALLLQFVSNALVSDCFAYACNIAYEHDNGASVVARPVFSGNVANLCSDGIRFTGSVGAVYGPIVTGNYLNSCGTGIRMQQGSEYAIIADNVFVDCNNEALATTLSHFQMQFTANTVRNCGRSGTDAVVLVDIAESNVSGNNVSGTAHRHGIRVEDGGSSLHNMVANNTCYDASASGLFIDGGDESFVSGNICRDNGTGITINSGTLIRVSNNLLLGNTTAFTDLGTSTSVGFNIP